MDDARLREPENLFGKDYFEEQLSVFVIFAPASAVFYQKSRTFTPNAVLTMM